MSTNSEKISMMQRRMTPWSQKIEQHKLLSSIKKGMMDINPVLLVGSIVSMLMILFKVSESNFTFLIEVTKILKILHFATFGLLGIYLSVSLSYHHSKKLKTPLFYSIFLSTITTVAIHLLINNQGLFEMNNIFISTVSSLLTVEMIHKFIIEKEENSHSWIPAGSKKTMKMIIFSMIYLFTILLLVLIVIKIFVENLGFLHLSSILNYFDTPAILFIIVLFEMLLWFIGLNGYSILAAIVLPFAMNNLLINQTLIQDGKSPTQIFTPNFWDFFVGMSGSGLVGALAVLAIFSKVDSLKEKGKIAIIPSIFHISEPILYGLPIAYNPYFFLPFVIGTPILSVAQWYVFRWGWVNLPSYHVADLPLPLAQILSTLDWRAVLLVIVIFLLSILMYYPFFKQYEKSVILTELNSKEEDRFSDLDLDF